MLFSSVTTKFLSRSSNTAAAAFRRNFHASSSCMEKLNVEGLAKKVDLDGKNVLVRVDLNVPLAKVRAKGNFYSCDFWMLLLVWKDFAVGSEIFELRQSIHLVLFRFKNTVRLTFLFSFAIFRTTSLLLIRYLCRGWFDALWGSSSELAVAWITESSVSLLSFAFGGLSFLGFCDNLKTHLTATKRHAAVASFFRFNCLV